MFTNKTKVYIYLQDNITDCSIKSLNQVHYLYINNEKIEIRYQFTLKDGKKLLTPNDVYNYFKSLGGTDKDLSKIESEHLTGEVLSMCSKEELHDNFGIPYGLIKLYHQGDKK